MPPKVLNQLHLSKTKKRQLKLSLQSQQQPQPSNTIIEEDDDDGGPEELDYHRSYGRPKVCYVDETVTDSDDQPLSDYITVRLAVARAKAIEKYRETNIKA
jgi:hypothetical protein